MDIAWIKRHFWSKLENIILTSSQYLEAPLVYITSNLGVGTTSPSYMLDIAGGDMPVRIKSGERDSATTDGYGAIELDQDDGAKSWKIRIGSSGTNYGLGFDRYNSSAWSNVMTLDRTTGFVGINDTTPSDRLTVGLGSQEYASAQNSSNQNRLAAFYQDSNGDGQVRAYNSSGAAKAIVHGLGYIQIADGVTAPTAASGWALLYVDTADGDLKIRFGDGTTKTIVTDT